MKHYSTAQWPKLERPNRLRASSHKAILHFSKVWDFRQQGRVAQYKDASYTEGAQDQCAPTCPNACGDGPATEGSSEVREPVTHHTLRPFHCKLSDFIGMGNHSFLRSHIIRGWEMLTNEQTTKWQRELSVLCTGVITGKSLTSSHSQADTFREGEQSLMSPPLLYAPWNCSSSQSMTP